MITIIILLLFLGWIYALKYRRTEKIINDIDDLGERVFKMDRMYRHKTYSIMTTLAAFIILIYELITFRHK
jgi:hypothetical protein